MTGVYVLLVVLAAATAFGLWRRSNDGRMRAVDAVRPAAEVPGPAGDAAVVPDDSEPLVVDGVPIEVPDHSVVPATDVLRAGDLGHELGERATLVQFSSAFCTPCRATRVILGDVTTMVPGVVHIEIDAEAHLELVRRVDVTRTPTVLVLDSQGRIRSRATGAPRKADVIAALGQVI